MKNLKIKLFGKPQKGFFFFSSGNTTEDFQKYDELKVKFALVDDIENKISKHLYKSLKKQLCNTKIFESQKNIIKDFYKTHVFTRGDLICRMRQLERSFKYDSAWYSEQYVGLVFAFFLGGFVDYLSEKNILTIIICTLLFFVYAGLILYKDLRKYLKVENRLYEINYLELELIKNILTKNEPEIDVVALIDQISLVKLYFNR